MAFSGTGPAPKPEPKERKRRSDFGRPRGSSKPQTTIPAETVEKVAAVVKAEAKAPRVSRGEPKPCTCGCGGMTKGGRFLPGHDARYHAAQKRAQQS